jgi:hypothetical protein
MIEFDTDKKRLVFLLDLIDEGMLALPDFQRSFVWDPNATRELIVSVIQGFPAGTLLLMQGGGTIFAPREFEGAPALSHEASFLALDGQQRLTSMYQAFRGVGTHRYFVNLRELIEDDPDGIDEAVEVYPSKQVKVWATIEGQARDLALPLERVADFSTWRDEVLEHRPETGEDLKKLKSALNDVERRVVKAIDVYVFPVTVLSKDTPIDAVCTIFETLNRTGVKLSAFELVTARAFAKEVQLRDMWRQALEKYSILEDFDVDPYYVLQSVAVLTAGSAKRSAVLKLPVESVLAEWDRVVSGMAGALKMLRDECGVLVERWLPYKTILVTLGAVWGAVDEASGPAIGARREKVRRWFWCSCFSSSYANSPNTQAEKDAIELTSWLKGGPVPPDVAGFSFDSSRWFDITARQRALYQSTVALMMSRTPLDFHQGKPIDRSVIEGEKVDDHHIFPRGWLADKGLSAVADTVLNHTLIDKVTNIRISKAAPSVYLAEMDRELPNLGMILRSHGLPDEPDSALWNDDYRAFLEWRRGFLATELARVTSGSP